MKTPSLMPVARRPRIPLSVRLELWVKPCVNCGSRNNVHIDHIVPYSKGGTNDQANLQPLCRSCNSLKGNRLNNAQLRRRTWWVKGAL